MVGGQTQVKRAMGRTQPGLSAALLDKQLGVRRRAREDGARNWPHQHADELSAAERAILEAAASERAELDRARLDAQAETERRLRALLPTPQDFSGPLIEARLALKQIAGRVGYDWTQARDRARAARADLDAFKRVNQIRRGAAYPSSGLLQAGLLFMAALFESLFSAALFAEDDARGLLGGAIVAIGLSGANVTLGFLAGFLGLRYLQHVRAPIKFMGGGAFAALTLMALMLNLFAADWRDVLAARAGAQLDMGADASFHLWSLLNLKSPQAIILLMLGAGVWSFAAIKGYSGFDDPYPDYGKMDRAAERANDVLSEFRTQARATLEAPIDTAKAAFAAKLAMMRSEFEAMSRAFDAAALKLAALDVKARALDEAAAGAIHLYRQENAAARSAPAPAYFGTTPPAIGPALDVLAASAAMIDDARARLQQAQGESAAALEALLAELDAATARLDADAGAAA
jgi:hypothetical protein